MFINADFDEAGVNSECAEVDVDVDFSLEVDGANDNSEFDRVASVLSDMRWFSTLCPSRSTSSRRQS